MQNGPPLKDVDVLEKLVEKTEKVLPPEGQWKVFYLGFARSGWAQNAITFARCEKRQSTR